MPTDGGGLDTGELAGGVDRDGSGIRGLTDSLSCLGTVTSLTPSAGDSILRSGRTGHRSWAAAITTLMDRGRRRSDAASTETPCARLRRRSCGGFHGGNVGSFHGGGVGSFHGGGVGGFHGGGGFGGGMGGHGR